MNKSTGRSGSPKQSRVPGFACWSPGDPDDLYVCKAVVTTWWDMLLTYVTSGISAHSKRGAVKPEAYSDLLVQQCMLNPGMIPECPSLRKYSCGGWWARWLRGKVLPAKPDGLRALGPQWGWRGVIIDSCPLFCSQMYNSPTHNTCK